MLFLHQLNNTKHAWIHGIFFYLYKLKSNKICVKFLYEQNVNQVLIEKLKLIHLFDNVILI